MKPILATLAFVLLFLSGFSQPKAKMTPLEYNDYLSSVTDSLYSKGEKWGTKFALVRGGDQDYSKLKPMRKDISAFLILKIEEVKKFPAVGKGGEAMKKAMLDFMDYELEMIETGFMPIENLTSASSDTDVETAFNKLVGESEKEGDFLKSVRAAQSVYAEANGFEIESGEEN